MSFHHAPSALTSHQAAFERMPSDPNKVGQFIGALFAAQAQKEETIARAREEAKIADYEAAAEREFGFVRPALRSANFWRKEFRRNAYRASIGFTQLMIVAEAEGWTKPVDKPENETPVFDRTSTARKMKSLNPTRDGSRASYGLTLQNAHQQEVAVTAERLYQKLVDGVPLNRLREGEGAGRPSRAWQEAYQLAYERFERETDPDQQPEAESEEQAH